MQNGKVCLINRGVDVVGVSGEVTKGGRGACIASFLPAERGRKPASVHVRGRSEPSREGRAPSLPPRSEPPLAPTCYRLSKRNIGDGPRRRLVVMAPRYDRSDLHGVRLRPTHRDPTSRAEGQTSGSSLDSIAMGCTIRIGLCLAFEPGESLPGHTVC